jgi:hypothetical protein
MPASDPTLLSSLTFKLREAFKQVRGLRKEISESDAGAMARSLIEELERSGIRLVRDTSGGGSGGSHVFRSPESPREAAYMTMRDAVVRAQKALGAYLDPGETDKEDPKAAIKALLGILDDKTLLKALAATDDATPDADPPPGV